MSNLLESRSRINSTIEERVAYQATALLDVARCPRCAKPMSVVPGPRGGRFLCHCGSPRQRFVQICQIEEALGIPF